MNILMVTNTYLPHVGGVARSVETFARAYRHLNHNVTIVAPEFEGMPEHEEGVIRVPAIQKFNGSDFSVRVPIPGFLHERLEQLRPDIVHSHHPFLMGDTALRIASSLDLPVVFTHHTMYERYTHYVPGDSEAMKRFVVTLATGYANLCHQVIAPSQSIADTLRNRGVETPISVIPTGIDVQRFGNGNGCAFRHRAGISEQTFVIGHVGRLAREKNLIYLSAAVQRSMKKTDDSVFLIVGSGPEDASIREVFSRAGMDHRLILAGSLTGQDLIDAYHAMDLFVFSSKTETQGVVLTEAMGAGVPVVALDAPAVRDIVESGRNGYLVSRESVRAFALAIESYQRLSMPEKKNLRDGARSTASQSDWLVCAVKALQVYEDCLRLKRSELAIRRSPWEKTLERLETEWMLACLKIGAAKRSSRSLIPKTLGTVRRVLRRIRRLAGRAALSVRLLRLPDTVFRPSDKGIVLLQIDGLSCLQFERALRSGRLPFIRGLLVKREYSVNSFYSGIPSSTPAVQAELFYGRQSAVPAFSFFNPDIGICSMLDSKAVQAVEEELIETEGTGLLQGGSCYCDIYHGGAEEAHFCPGAMSSKSFFKRANPLRILLVVLMHISLPVRLGLLFCVEFVLALCDCIDGIIKRENLLQEIKFIPTRLAVCIFLREMATAGVMMDIHRGRPIIHVNFLGYDEQSHRRGPDSYFAHWTLKGIDQAVANIWRAAQRSQRRKYDVWIYSDHGQERTESYRDIQGCTVQEAVSRLCKPQQPSEASPGRYLDSREYHRSRMIGGWLKRFLPAPPRTNRFQVSKDSKVVITAKGPMGHVYLGEQASLDEKVMMARRLTETCGVPLVLVNQDVDHCQAITRDGVYKLPDEAANVFDPEQPFFAELIDNLILVCRHKSSGDLIISGWSRHQHPISFPIEKGAHGGPGTQETHGFALIPDNVFYQNEKKAYLRPKDLRRLALSCLQQSDRGVERVEMEW